jgi:hypothetical protein
MLGTFIYNAPELWSLRYGKSSKEFSYAIDIWALGITSLLSKTRISIYVTGLVFLQLWCNVTFDPFCDFLNTCFLAKNAFDPGIASVLAST